VRLSGRRLDSSLSARAEAVAEHAANIVLVRGQGVRQTAGGAILQVGDECRIAIARSSRDRRHSAAWTEGGIEDRQSRLAGESEIGERAGLTVLRIDRQVVLRVLEFLEESVLENIDFV